MAEFLVVPIVVFLILFTVWSVSAAKKTRDAAKAERTLPDEPYARRQEEIRRLKQEHADADPARTAHPARRP